MSLYQVGGQPKKNVWCEHWNTWSRYGGGPPVGRSPPWGAAPPAGVSPPRGRSAARAHVGALRGFAVLPCMFYGGQLVAPIRGPSLRSAPPWGPPCPRRKGGGFFGSSARAIRAPAVPGLAMRRPRLRRGCPGLAPAGPSRVPASWGCGLPCPAPARVPQARPRPALAVGLAPVQRGRLRPGSPGPLGPPLAPHPAVRPPWWARLWLRPPGGGRGGSFRCGASPRRPAGRSRPFGSPAPTRAGDSPRVGACCPLPLCCRARWVGRCLVLLRATRRALTPRTGFSAPDGVGDPVLPERKAAAPTPPAVALVPADAEELAPQAGFRHVSKYFSRPFVREKPFDDAFQQINRPHIHPIHSALPPFYHGTPPPPPPPFSGGGTALASARSAPPSGVFLLLNDKSLWVWLLPR